ncbi:MAG: ribonuclease III [Clostridiaceae bacterium]|nr:ribonuclease III [Clostridiaceae bacterium]
MELIFPRLEREELMKISSLGLAHVGDGVYELLARTYTARTSGGLAGQMHRRTTRLARASFQSKAVLYLLEQKTLLPEEEEVYRRGRNSHSHAAPKSASPEEYARATGLEAVFGWLYLTGQQERTCRIFEKILAMTPEGEPKK